MINHYILSNRNLNEEADVESGKGNSSKGAEEFTMYEYSFERGHCGKGTLQAIPEFDKAKDKPELPDVESLFSNLLEADGETISGDILFHIHGFGNDNDTVKRLVEMLHEKYVEPNESPVQTIVLVAWPSVNKNDYKGDRKRAKATGKQLANSFAKVVQIVEEKVKPDFIGVSRIHMFAVSMGNQVLEAFIDAATSNDSFSPHISELFSIAADVDDDVFNAKKTFAKVDLISNRTHVYFHCLDAVLQISQRVMNSGYRRLGQYGPCPKTELPEGVNVVNAMGAIKTDKPNCAPTHYSVPLNHYYHFVQNRVVEDVIHVLQGWDAEDIPTRRPSWIYDKYYAIKESF